MSIPSLPRTGITLIFKDVFDSFRIISAGVFLSLLALTIYIIAFWLALFPTWSLHSFLFLYFCVDWVFFSLALYFLYQIVFSKFIMIPPYLFYLSLHCLWLAELLRTLNLYFYQIWKFFDHYSWNSFFHYEFLLHCECFIIVCLVFVLFPLLSLLW